MKKWFLILACTSVWQPGFTQRNLELEKSPNFRTYDGLANKNGQRLKPGMVFRSGSIANLGADDKTKIQQLGITVIVDFRADHEIAREPDDTAGMQVQYHNVKIGKLDQQSMANLMASFRRADLSEAEADSIMISLYRGFVNNIADYKPLFDQFLKQDAKILFHCSAGKDRTGIASALFLYALGFSYDTIVADFERSNEAVKKLDPSRLSSYGISEPMARILMGVKRQYIDAAWKEMIRQYGSIDLLLAKAFGVGEKERKILMQKYLG